MASDFVRNIKDVRNIDILSRNIVTENDLISTTEGEVYVVTKKGYKKITNVETQDFNKLKTKVENLKNQSETNTSGITDLQTTTDNNTSEIETLKTTTDNNTSEIEILKTTTDNNTSEIETLKTSTDTNTNDIATLKTDVSNNTSEIETLKTSATNNTSEIDALKTTTDNNTSEISTLKKSIDNNTTEINTLKNKIEDIEVNINSLNEYIEVKTFSGIDLMDKNSLDDLPLGVNYLTRAKNKTEEMNTGNGWLTIHYGNNMKRLMFQPFSEGRTYYNYILDDTLGEWQ